MSFFKALVIATLAVVFFSLFGSFILGAVLLVSGIAMALISAFWPILLLALIIWLVTQNKEKAQRL